MNEVTQILHAIDRGDRIGASQEARARSRLAADQLLPLVYDELRKLAAQKLAHETPGQTLDATALVHEAYLRLVGADAEAAPHFANRRHFLAAAAEAMRRILVENARRKRRLKHGGRRLRLELHDSLHRSHFPNDDILAVDEALQALEKIDPAVAALVKLHFFTGLPLKDSAEALGISERTAYRDWAYARAWLARFLKRSNSAAKKK
jgi:RNA polymerase sigma factor (TIGR02999 family)